MADADGSEYLSQQVRADAESLFQKEPALVVDLERN
jgi:hypothetical protein